MTLGEMRSLLETRGIRLTKSLGQNFLHDANQLRRIVTAAGLLPGERVLEIGPGLGPLTAELLAHADAVLAIEKDVRLVEVLRERFAGATAGPRPRLEIIHADALCWIGENPRDWAGWKLVANLPYSVASPILVDLVTAAMPPDRMVATLQAEVVRRIAAAPDTEDYGVLTLLLGLRYSVAGWFGIPRGCFHPSPEVDSACVTLVRRPEPLLSPAEAPHFMALVKLAFSQRRKMMMKLLRQRWEAAALAAAFEAVGIPATERAEKLPVGSFVELARRLPTRG